VFGGVFCLLALSHTWSEFPYGVSGAILVVAASAALFSAFGVFAAWLFLARTS
jgi:hypothetical protein